MKKQLLLLTLATGFIAGKISAEKEAVWDQFYRELGSGNSIVPFVPNQIAIDEECPARALYGQFPGKLTLELATEQLNNSLQHLNFEDIRRSDPVTAASIINRIKTLSASVHYLTMQAVAWIKEHAHLKK